MEGFPPLIFPFEYIPANFKPGQPACFGDNWKAYLFCCSKQGKRIFFPWTAVFRIISCQILALRLNLHPSRHVLTPLERSILSNSFLLKILTPSGEGATWCCQDFLHKNEFVQHLGWSWVMETVNLFTVSGNISHSVILGYKRNHILIWSFLDLLHSFQLLTQCSWCDIAVITLKQWVVDILGSCWLLGKMLFGGFLRMSPPVSYPCSLFTLRM